MAIVPSYSRQEVIARIVRGEADIASLEASQHRISPQEVAFATPMPYFAVGVLYPLTVEQFAQMDEQLSAVD